MNPAANSTRRWSARAASAAVMTTLAMILLSLVLLWLNRATPIGPAFGVRGFQGPFALAFVLPGALLMARRPENRLGWMFCFTGVLAAAQMLAVEYGIYALLTRRNELPLGLFAAWLQYWIWIPMVLLPLSFLPMLFPDGRLKSVRWLPIGWLTIISVTVMTVTEALTPGIIGEEFETVENPYAVIGFDGLLSALFLGCLAVVLLITLVGAALLLLDLRRAQGIRRQQFKWFAYAIALAALTFLIASVTLPFARFERLGGIVFLVGFMSVPIAAGVAMLRYRLYDIDLIIRRTLVYGLLTGLLALVYFGTVVAVQALVRLMTGQESDSPLIIVVSTLLIAALFTPLRRAVQGAIDRRFYRQKYDAGNTLTRFARSARDEVELHALVSALTTVVQETMQPERSGVWLRGLSDDD